MNDHKIREPFRRSARSIANRSSPIPLDTVATAMREATYLPPAVQKIILHEAQSRLGEVITRLSPEGQRRLLKYGFEQLD